MSILTTGSRALVCGLALLAPWWLNTGVAQGAAGAGVDSRPNILFIMTDQQYAEAMSCRMGKDFISTPAMDSLARNGVVFTRSYSANPLCAPARNSMFTGYYPHQTGVINNNKANYPEGINPKTLPDLGEYFQKAGYRTAYYGKTHLTYDWKKSFQDSRLKKPVVMAEKNPDSQAAACAVEFLSQKSDQPFLMVLSLLNPHNFCELSRDERLPCGPIGDAPAPEQCPPVPANMAAPEGELELMTAHRQEFQGFTPEKIRQLRWGYYRLIEKADAQVGALLEALRKQGLEKNTLIVFTSDHGECVGAHGCLHKIVFYEESVRVPLIVSWPGKIQPGIKDALINTGIDILPTLMDAARIPVPAALPGRSVLPLALGQPVTGWRDYVVSQNHLGSSKSTIQGRMVRTERFKYCIYTCGTPRESLVDLQSDPGEMKNLAGNPAYSQVLAQHRDLLAKYGQEQHDDLVPKLLAAGEPLPAVMAKKKLGKREKPE